MLSLLAQKALWNIYNTSEPVKLNPPVSKDRSELILEKDHWQD